MLTEKEQKALLQPLVEEVLTRLNLLSCNDDELNKVLFREFIKALRGDDAKQTGQVISPAQAREAIIAVDTMTEILKSIKPEHETGNVNWATSSVYRDRPERIKMVENTIRRSPQQAQNALRQVVQPLDAMKMFVKAQDLEAMFDTMIRSLAMLKNTYVEIAEGSRCMTEEMFRSMVTMIRKKTSSTNDADMLRYRLELVTQDEVEAKPEHRSGYYIDLENNLNIERSHVTFRVLPDAMASWLERIKEVHVTLPYTSIRAIVEVVGREGESKFVLLVSNELRLDMI